MKRINGLDLLVLRNDEHAQFHSDIFKVIMLHTAIKLGVVKLIGKYESAIAAEEAAMLVDQGSVFTKTITQADEYRDQLDRSFNLLVESKTYDYDPVVRESAWRVERILQQYGNLRKLTYNEESKGLTNRSLELNSKYAADVALIGGTELLARGDQANDEFSNHFGDRANEKAAVISGNVRTARQEVDDAYDAIVNQINALALVNGDTDYAEFIDQTNYYVKYYKNVLAARKGRNKPDGTKEK